MPGEGVADDPVRQVKHADDVLIVGRGGEPTVGVEGEAGNRRADVDLLLEAPVVASKIRTRPSRAATTSCVPTKPSPVISCVEGVRTRAFAAFAPRSTIATVPTSVPTATCWPSRAKAISTTPPSTGSVRSTRPSAASRSRALPSAALAISSVRLSGANVNGQVFCACLA